VTQDDGLAFTQAFQRVMINDMIPKIDGPIRTIAARFQKSARRAGQGRGKTRLLCSARWGAAAA
jgi:hypothetical protein